MNKFIDMVSNIATKFGNGFGNVTAVLFQAVLWEESYQPFCSSSCPP